MDMTLPPHNPTQPPVRTNIFARRVWLPINDVIEGTAISRQLSLFEQSQWWKPEELVAYQNTRLSSLIHHAYTNVPYYHDLFRSLDISPSDIKTKEDLVKLPVLTKEDIRKSPERFIAQNIPRTSLIHEATSGSSGKVFEYFIDKNVMSVFRALGLRGWGFAGYSIGDNMVTLAGSSLLPENMPFYKRIRFKFSHNLPLSSYYLKERMEDYLKWIIQFNPRYIRGYPSSLAILADYALNHGIDAISPAGVMTTAETLTPSQRETISSAFQCKVFDQFGCFDGGATAHECDQHRGYHISVERSVHEFLDTTGYPVDSGTNGHIILTDLWNYAMPFIRYDAGDMGVPTDRLCPCGRGLPLIERITGRTTELIVLRDGTRFPGLILTDIFDQRADILHAVLDYQIIQETVNKFVINIVRSDQYSPAISDEIQKFFVGQLGSDIEIQFNFYDEIPRTEANKRRIVICKVNNVKNPQGT
jgi:phenylacetate-CoA ligase